MRTAVLFIALTGLATPIAAAQPRVINGDVQAAALPTPLTRAALDQFAGRAATGWLGYAVPIVPGDRFLCDGLTMVNGIPARRGDERPGVMMLEGPRELWVLYRLDAGRVDRIRVASETCTLDAGGLTVHWFAKVSAAESVALLGSFLTDTVSQRVADGAVTALALHRDPAALERLLAAARDGATSHLRGQALFWLAQRAGDKAVGAISDAIANDPETEVKKRAVFALSQLPKDDGVPRLIDLARTHSNPVVRKQAMFWLGQSHDPRAVRFFEEVLFK